MTDMDKLQELYQKINEADEKGALLEMSGYMRDAIELTRKVYGNDSKELIEMLTDQGGLLKYLGMYKESEEDLDEALTLIGKHQGRDSLEYGTGLLNMAGLYRFQGRIEEAEALMLRAKNLYEKWEVPAAYYNASVCNNLGLVYQEQKRWSEAAELHEKSLKIIQEGVASRYEYAVTLNNLWPCYIRIGKTAEAEEYMQTALNVLSEEVGEESAVYSAALNNCATYRYAKGEYKTALDMFIRSRDITEKTLGKESNNYKKVLQHIEMCKKKLGETAE